MTNNVKLLHIPLTDPSLRLEKWLRGRNILFRLEHEFAYRNVHGRRELRCSCRRRISLQILYVCMCVTKTTAASQLAPHECIELLHCVRGKGYVCICNIVGDYYCDDEHNDRQTSRQYCVHSFLVETNVASNSDILILIVCVRA